MFNPLSFIGMLGTGLPQQSGGQQIAQAADNQAMAGNGRRRRAMVTGTPGSISPTPNIGAMSPSNREMPDPAPDMPTGQMLPTPNDNGMARMPFGRGVGKSFQLDTPNPDGGANAAPAPSAGVALPRASMNFDLSEFATPPFVREPVAQPGSQPAGISAPPLPPTVENPKLTALRNSIASMPDPYAVANERVSHYGKGHKILNGILGGLSGLFGNSPESGSGILGGITNAIHGYRGDNDRRLIAGQVQQQNQSRRQGILDQINLEKEIQGEQDRQRERDIAAGNYNLAGQRDNEISRHNAAEEANQRVRYQYEADKAAQDRAWDQKKFDVEHKYDKERYGTPKPKDNILSSGYGDDGRGTYLEVQPDGTVISKYAPGATRYNRPPSRGGSGGAGSKTDKVLNRQLLQENRRRAYADAEKAQLADEENLLRQEMAARQQAARDRGDEDEADANDPDNTGEYGGAKRFTAELKRRMNNAAIRAVVEARAKELMQDYEQEE